MATVRDSEPILLVEPDSVGLDGAVHEWPWPYKFAVICNFPAFLLGLLPSWPLGFFWPSLPEYVETMPVLLFVLPLWSWVGSRLDRRWRVTHKIPWIGLFFFTLISLGGAFLPIGYTGYLPYGLALWLVTAVVVRLVSRQAPAADRAH